MILRGFAILDQRAHGWLTQRTRVEPGNIPVTLWSQEEAEALTFTRLDDAKRMIRLVRGESRHPERICLVSRQGKVVC